MVIFLVKTQKIVLNGTNNASPFFGGQRKDTQNEESTLDYMNQIDKKYQKTVPAPVSQPKMQAYARNVPQPVSAIGKLQKNKRSYSENRTIDFENNLATYPANNENPVFNKYKEASKTARNRKNSETSSINKVTDALFNLEKSLKEIGCGQRVFTKAEEYIKNKLSYFFNFTS